VALDKDTDNVSVAGRDPSGRKRFLLSDTDGHLQIDQLTSANPPNLDVALSTRATEATLSSLNAKVTACDTGSVTIASSALPTGASTEAKQDSLIALFSNASAQLFGADETVAQSITLDSAGRPVLEVYARASAATTFYLDVSPDNVNWINGYKSWATVTEVKDGYFNSFRYLRLRSVAAGVSGDTIDLVLTSAR